MDVVRLLLDNISRGVNPEDRDNLAFTAAADSVRAGIIRLLLDRRRKYITDDVLHVALEAACFSEGRGDDQTEVIRLLLEDEHIDVARVNQQCMQVLGPVGDMLREYARTHEKRQKIRSRLLK